MAKTRMNIKNMLFSLVNKLGLSYTQWICKKEYHAQNFTGVNERPVELAFVFRQLVRKCPKTVLDVGTGISSLPHLMRNCGFVVTALDNIRDYWTYGMINRHYYVMDDDITRTHLTINFDFIACISVLEHIKNHRAAFKSMFALLNPGGHLILTFPYNENNYINNVYKLPGSVVTEDFPFITQVFSRRELESWLSENSGIILEQEYWKFFTGEYWTIGEMINPPVPVDKNENHHISCILIQKPGL